MSRWVRLALCCLFCGAMHVSGSEYPQAVDSLGRPATAAEVRAWDIDVRPDFQGLPPGRGSVEQGEALWLERCANCHGDFGDSNEMFAPIVLGNVTEADIESGQVAALTDPASVRTTFMKIATLSTLWDYINRAMPWNAPKSLTTDEVYAVVAYLLNLAYVVDYDFVLSDQNIAQVQQRMPNRNGMTRDHGLWSVNGQLTWWGHPVWWIARPTSPLLPRYPSTRWMPTAICRIRCGTIVLSRVFRPLPKK